MDFDVNHNTPFSLYKWIFVCSLRSGLLLRVTFCTSFDILYIQIIWHSSIFFNSLSETKESHGCIFGERVKDEVKVVPIYLLILSIVKKCKFVS